MYFTAPATPSTPPWNKPGAIELSTSATCAMWIVLASTPTSVAVGASAAWATSGSAAIDTVSATAPTRTRTVVVPCLTFPPRLDGCSESDELRDPGGGSEFQTIRFESSQ